MRGVSPYGLGAALSLVLVAWLVGSGCGSDRPPDPIGGSTVSAGGAESAEGAFAERSYAPWPGALHDPAHTSSSPAEGPTSGKVLWRRRLEGAVVPGPAVGRDGTIYAASNGGVLHAFDPDGNELWSFDGGSSYGSDLSTTPAITREGTILWPGPGALYALSPEGDLRWRQSFGSSVLSPLLGPSGAVYVMEMSGTLHALDADASGARELWSLQLGEISYSSPALGTDGAVYAGAENSLFAVDPPAGGDAADVAWEFETGDLIEVSPAVAPDGTIVIGSNDANEYGVAPDGSERWRRDLGEITYSSPAVSANGAAYFGDHSGAVTAVDAADGALINRYPGQARTNEVTSVGIWTAPLIDAEGRVYFGTSLGHVYGFSAGGKQLFDVDTGETVDSYPALTDDGTLLIGSENGFLYAIGDQKRLDR